MEMFRTGFMASETPAPYEDPEMLPIFSLDYQVR
jgi:hypothetical protein